MSDGFSSPDPANVPGDEPDDPDEGQMMLVTEDTHCENCIHFDTCAYYAGIKPMLEDPQTGHGEPPFDAGQLAAICQFFELNEDALSD